MKRPTPRRYLVASLASYRSAEAIDRQSPWPVELDCTRQRRVWHWSVRALQIRNARVARQAFDRFIAKYGSKYNKAANCLSKDRETLFTFSDWRRALETRSDYEPH